MNAKMQQLFRKLDKDGEHGKAAALLRIHAPNDPAITEVMRRAHLHGLPVNLLDSDLYRSRATEMTDKVFLSSGRARAVAQHAVNSRKMALYKEFKIFPTEVNRSPEDRWIGYRFTNEAEVTFKPILDEDRLLIALLTEGRWEDAKLISADPVEGTPDRFVIPAMYRALREGRLGVAAALGQIALEEDLHCRDKAARGETRGSVFDGRMISRVATACAYARMMPVIAAQKKRYPALEIEPLCLDERLDFIPEMESVTAPPRNELIKDGRVLTARIRRAIHLEIDSLLRRCIHTNTPLELDFLPKPNTSPTVA